MSEQEANQVMSEQSLLILKLQKENENLREEIYKRREWIRKAKKQAGYSDSSSFDVVWEETLLKAKNSTY